MDKPYIALAVAVIVLAIIGAIFIANLHMIPGDNRVVSIGYVAIQDAELVIVGEPGDNTTKIILHIVLKDIGDRDVNIIRIAVDDIIVFDWKFNNTIRLEPGQSYSGNYTVAELQGDEAGQWRSGTLHTVRVTYQVFGYSGEEETKLSVEIHR